MAKYNFVAEVTFKDMIELVAECRGWEIQTHFLTTPKKATYLSPQHISNSSNGWLCKETFT